MWQNVIYLGAFNYFLAHTVCIHLFQVTSSVKQCIIACGGNIQNCLLPKSELGL